MAGHRRLAAGHLRPRPRASPRSTIASDRTKTARGSASDGASTHAAARAASRGANSASSIVRRSPHSSKSAATASAALVGCECPACAHGLFECRPSQLQLRLLRKRLAPAHRLAHGRRARLREPEFAVSATPSKCPSPSGSPKAVFMAFIVDCKIGTATSVAAAAELSCLASISAIAIEAPARLTACTPFGPSAACFRTLTPL
jgi:hypothetical protein